MADDDLKSKLEGYEKYQRSISNLSGEWADDLERIVDLSSKLGNSIRTNFNSLKETQEKYKQQVDYSNKLGESLKSNGREVAALKAAQSDNNKILEERQRLLDGEAETIKDIERLNQSILKNTADQTINVNALLENRKKQKDIDGDIQSIEKEIAEAQLAAIRDGVVDQEKYNNLVAKHNYYTKKSVELKATENEYMKDGVRLSGRGVMLDAELYSKKAKQQDIQADLTSGAEKYNKAEKNNLLINGQINTLLEKGKAIRTEKNAIDADNIKLLEKINNLTGQWVLLNMLKLGYERFVALDKAAEDFRKTTGFTNTQMVELRKNVEAVNKDFAALGVSIEVAYKAAQALTDVFGRTSLVTKDAIENIALMSANLGVVEADSAEVLSIFQGMGGATQEVAMNTMMAGAALSEKTGVPFSKVMGDIAKSSGTTAMLLGTTPSKLMKAAIAARALGTDLNTIAAQQEKLLNYSDSINSELEASALLGRSISFQRARQLAYEGKVEESAKATLDMVKQAGDFNEMNIYQRKALAAASGMELKDLTKMMAVEAQKNEIRMKGTPEQKKQLEMQEAELKKLRETNDLTKDSVLEENKKAIAQAKIQGLMTQINGILDQMKTTFADLFEPVITPLVKVLIPAYKILSFVVKLIAPIIKGMFYPIQLAAEYVAKLTDKFDVAVNTSKEFKEFFEKDVVKVILGAVGVIAGGGLLIKKMFFGGDDPKSVLEMVKAPFNAVKDGAKNLMQRATGKSPMAQIAGPSLPDPSKGIADTAKAGEKVPSGTGVKDFLTNLAAGLKKMGDGKVLFGALNLIPASIGLIAMIPAAIGMAAIGVTGQLFAVGAKGLATGLSALANPKVLLGTLALLGIGGAFALFGLGAKLVADAFVSIAAVIPDAIVPLTQLALLSPLLYVAAGGIGALAVGLGVLAAATIPATVASVGIYIIAKSVEKLGTSFEQVSKSTISLAKSIPTVINPIKQFASINMKETAEGMMLLSNSLASFGVGSAVAGIGSFVGNFLGGDPIAKMEKLASISDRLKDAASAISLIATATSRFSAVDSFAKSVGILADSLNKLTDSLGDIKTEELAKLSTITGATSAKTETAPTSATMTTGGIEAKLDKLTELLIGGAVKVHIDGKLVSSAMANTAGR